MVKAIRFNLILDGNPVRNLEGLRKNFNINDVLRYYNNGLLKTWLSVRGYTDSLSKIESISSQDERKIIRDLVNIFEIEIDSKQLEESLYSIVFHKQWQTMLSDNARNNFQHQEVIQNYCNGYDSLLKDMLADKDNMALMKNSMRQISENYLGIFKYHLPSFYDEFMEKAPLAIFVSLMNPVLREYFLSSELSNKFSKDSIKILEVLRNIFDLLKNHLKTFKGDTKEYWNVIESKGNKFMLIGMREGNFVRNAGKDGEKLSASDVNGKFPILDGIDYMSNNPEHEIGYLEV